MNCYNRKIIKHIFLLLITAVFLCSSCGSPKKIIYFQGIDRLSGNVYENDASHYEVTITPNDNLLIIVSAINPGTVEMFNLVKSERLAYSISDYQGYLVDRDGCINFPVIGRIALGGLTKEQAVQLLQDEISEYVENPTVNIRLMNYKVSVLGEVARPGVFTVSNEKITITEALAMAGDVTINGVRKEVLLCRTVNDQKEFHRIDLTRPDLFFSPYYFLKQNDIIYVQPNRAKIGSASSFYRNTPLFISAASLVLTLAALFLK